MPMTHFPLPDQTFPEMKFLPYHLAEFIDTRDQLLDATMTAYQEFEQRCHGKLDPKRWKVCKRKCVSSGRNNSSSFTVYTPRRGVSQAPRASINCSPMMIGIGSMNDTSLEEIMLGLVSSDTPSMRNVTMNLYNDVLDAKVLSTLQPTTATDPFDFVGIKWMVKGPSIAMKSLLRQRDFVYLESTGIRDMTTHDSKNGRGQHTQRRVGHLLLHSVDLPQGGSLQGRYSIVRGILSYCFLFVEQDNGQLDVFVKGFVDPQGGIAQWIAISSAADALIASMDAPQCAQQKKLDWIIRQIQAGRTSQDYFAVPEALELTDSSNNTRETIVEHEHHVPANKCYLCMSTRNGHVNMPVSSVMNGKKPDFCHDCMGQICQVDPIRIAVSEAARAMRGLQRFASSSDAQLLQLNRMRKLQPLKKRSQSFSVNKGIFV